MSAGGQQRSIGEWNRRLAPVVEGAPTGNNLWLGKGKWGVRGDGITEPWCVYQLDPTRSAFGFLPYGYGLPGMLEQQARALCDLLNEMQLGREAD